MAFGSSGSIEGYHAIFAGIGHLVGTAADCSQTRGKAICGPMDDSEKGGSSENRRKRLLFRAQRRGFKEVDLIFGAYAGSRACRAWMRPGWTSSRRC